MTALAGFVAFDGRDPLAPCRRMLKAQALYGRSPADWSDGVAALGRQLFATLPEDRFDRGPVVGAGGRLVLVADTRIDNRAELEDSLGLSRPTAVTLSDAALLLHAFERWEDEEEVMRRVVGDLAFALWDAARRRLLLGRDYIGSRPLHFHRGLGFLAFSTMAKGLHALPEVPYGLNREAARDAVALIPPKGGGTLFEGVERVQPGCLVAVTPGGIEARRWWRPDVEPLRLASAGDYQEAMREALDRATLARLRGAEGSVGAHLSAGLDSAAVAATAARLMRPSGGRVVGFTAVPREGYDGPFVANTIGDEGPLAAATAAMHPNIEHVLVRTPGRSPFEQLDRYFHLYERPLLNLCNGVWITAIDEEAKRRGLTIMLTGAMGNMSHSYNGMEHLPELLGQGRLLRLARTALALRRHGVRAGTIAAQIVGPYLPNRAWQAIHRLRGAGAALSDYSLARGDDAVLSERLADDGLDASRRRQRDPVATRLWALARVDPGTIHKGQLASSGIDQRDPTADRRLMEFCLRVPMEQYLRGGRPRALAREGLADRLPAAVLDEPLKGLQASDWHENLAAGRDALREEAERLARSDDVAAVIDTERLLRLVDDWPQDGWASKKVVGAYRLALLRGVSTGHFIRRVTGSN